MFTIASPVIVFFQHFFKYFWW